MNREKYMNDESYREGYDDGRKEGANSIASIIMRYLDMSSNNNEFMKKLLSDTINTEEGNNS